MALFGIGKQKEKAENKAPASEKKEAQRAPTKSTTPVRSARAGESDLSHVLRTPRITEKATMLQESNIYSFEVAERATKSQVKDAVHALYGVVPQKVRMVAIPSKEKRNMRTGARGFTRGGKKAFVYLKKGETITIT